jgi:hypothetical protein
MRLLPPPARWVSWGWITLGCAALLGAEMAEAVRIALALFFRVYPWNMTRYQWYLSAPVCSVLLGSFPTLGCIAMILLPCGLLGLAIGWWSMTVRPRQS